MDDIRNIELELNKRIKKPYYEFYENINIKDIYDEL